MVDTGFALELVIKYMERESMETRPLRISTQRLWTFAQARQIGRKLSVNCSIAGPYQSGKSTLVGLLLTLLKAVPQADLKTIESYKDKFRVERDRFRWVMDVSASDREDGVTRDISRRWLELDNYYVSFINTPGIPRLVRNRISGLAQSDTMLFVVPADIGEKDGPLKEIGDILKIAIVSQLKQIILAVSKMDLFPKDQQEHAFRTASEIFCQIAKKSGFKQPPIAMIPVSARGDNVVSPGFSEWYSGCTLRNALEKFQLPLRELHKPLRITIDKAYTIKGVGTVVAGTVIQGIVHWGQHAKIGPINRITHIRSLHLAIPKIPVEFGVPGDYIAMNITNVSKDDCRARRLGLITGFLQPSQKEKYIAGKIKSQLTPKPSRCGEPTNPKDIQRALRRKIEAPFHPAKSFKARVYFFGSANVSLKNSELVMHCHNAQVTVRVESVVGLYNYSKFVPTEIPYLWSILPTDVTNVIFSLLPMSVVISTLAQVNRYFYHLVTDQALWSIVGLNHSTKRYPTLDTRQSWMMDHMYQQVSFLEKGWPMTALVHLQAVGSHGLAIDTHLKCPRLGRFLLRNGNLLGGGIILDTEYFACKY